MDILTTKEIAEKLNVNEETVRRWIRDGKLDAEDLGKGYGYRVSSKELERFLTEHKGWTRAVSSAITGTTMGAAVGSLIPGVGTLLGSALGLAVGSLFEKTMVFLNDDKLDPKNVEKMRFELVVKKLSLEKEILELEAKISSHQHELTLLKHELKTINELLPVVENKLQK
ncbi:helix-turn-helix domain-containing protein [Neobacillus pocheonensis]|uniref:helix-turn-helix domain-containing protein n=1 Tax=Neobacillus pocheonensis TaxID=363869 RepID=UPI003D28D076